MVQWKTRFACAPWRAGRAIALAAIILLFLVSTSELRAQAAKAAAPAAAAATPAEAPPARTYLEAGREGGMPLDPPTLRGWQRMLSGQGDSLATHAKNVTRGDEALGDGADFDKFFTKQLFPQFTIYTVEKEVKGTGQTSVIVIDGDDKDPFRQQSRLPNMRQVFTSQFLNPCKDKVVYDRLAGLAVNSMRDIALKNYHPLARYNAVQLLGVLHEYQSPQPYAAAWKVLVECLAADSSPVKVAAMNAILRNAKDGVPPDQQPALVSNLEKILADKKVAANETQEAHDWTRRKAIDVLLALGDPAASAKVVSDLAAILNDSQSVELCCAAAKALGTVRSAALSAVDLSSAVANIGRAGVAAARGELDRADFRAFLAPLPVQNPQGGGFGGRQGAAPGTTPDAADAVPETPPVQTFINVGALKAQLTELLAAFKGPGGGITAVAAGGPAEQKAAAIQEGLTALVATCDPKATDYAALRQKIEGAATALDAKLGKTPVAAAPAAAGKAPAAAKSLPSGADPLEGLDKAAAPAAKDAGGK
jgi:hypothetical protein